jgi:hypothetical protein
MSTIRQDEQPASLELRWIGESATVGLQAVLVQVEDRAELIAITEEAFRDLVQELLLAMVQREHPVVLQTGGRTARRRKMGLGSSSWTGCDCARRTDEFIDHRESENQHHRQHHGECAQPRRGFLVRSHEAPRQIVLSAQRLFALCDLVSHAVVDLTPSPSGDRLRRVFTGFSEVGSDVDERVTRFARKALSSVRRRMSGTHPDRRERVRDLLADRAVQATARRQLRRLENRGLCMSFARRRAVVFFVALTITGAGCGRSSPPLSEPVTATPATTRAAATGGWPRQYSAPYVETAQPGFVLPEATQTSNNRFWTLGFVIGTPGRCDGQWSNGDPIGSDYRLAEIQSLRARGGDIGISIGGEQGHDPAHYCSSATDTQAVYQRLVDHYALTHLDFDIEEQDVEDIPAVKRRNQAVAALESANPALRVTYTLPIEVAGFDPEPLAALADARRQGVRIDVVNLMTMDFGQRPTTEGAGTISAAVRAVDQLRALWPALSTARRWARIGLTPMIGVNDETTQIFDLDDAALVLAFARLHHIAELSFWAAGRDSGRCVGAATPREDCSGLRQRLWEFTTRFAAFTSS